jgi:putative protease
VEGEVSSGVVELTFHGQTIDFQQLRSGQKVWKSDDPALSRHLRQSFAGPIRGRDRPLDLHVEARVGDPLRVRVQAAGREPFECRSESPLAQALRHPLTIELAQHQFSRLGGWGFVLRSLSAAIEGTPMVPLSVFGRLRRSMIEQLAAQRDRATCPSPAVCEQPVLPGLRQAIRRAAGKTSQPQLSVLCRSLDQLRVALEHGAPLLYADFQDIREYRQAVALAHGGGARIYLATPRIQKPGEIGIFHALARHHADGILVRNLAGLEFFASRRVACIADYSLNAANELTVDYLLEQGARRVTASYDLNRDQLLELARHADPCVLEVVVHQHMPMFHMEHCVFCAVLSAGTDKTNCGRPCDRHVVQLRDRVGSLHLLKADVGCRNTLFNGTAQSAAEAVPQLLRLGVCSFRVELLHEDPPPHIHCCLDLYQDLIHGRKSGRAVWTALRAVNRAGVTRGTLEHGRDPLALL